MDQRVAMPPVVELEPGLQQMPPARRARRARVEQRLGLGQRGAARFGAALADRDLRLGQQALALDRGRGRGAEIALRARRLGTLPRAGLVERLHQRVLPLLHQARADRGRLEHLAHRQLDPEDAFEAEPGNVVGEGGDPGATAHRRRDRLVAELARDSLGLRPEPRVVEGMEPADDERAGARQQTVAGIGHPLHGGHGFADRAGGVVEAGVVVVGDADELDQGGGGDQCPKRVAAGPEQMQRGVQFVASLLEVGERQAESAFEQPPAVGRRRGAPVAGRGDRAGAGLQGGPTVGAHRRARSRRRLCAGVAGQRIHGRLKFQA